MKRWRPAQGPWGRGTSPRSLAEGHFLSISAGCTLTESFPQGGPGWAVKAWPLLQWKSWEWKPVFSPTADNPLYKAFPKVPCAPLALYELQRRKPVLRGSLCALRLCSIVSARMVLWDALLKRWLLFSPCRTEDGLKTKRISFFTTRGRQRSGTEAGVCGVAGWVGGRTGVHCSRLVLGFLLRCPAGMPEMAAVG